MQRLWTPKTRDVGPMAILGPPLGSLGGRPILQASRNAVLKYVHIRLNGREKHPLVHSHSLMEGAGPTGDTWFPVLKGDAFLASKP